MPHAFIIDINGLRLQRTLDAITTTEQEVIFPDLFGDLKGEARLYEIEMPPRITIVYVTWESIYQFVLEQTKWTKAELDGLPEECVLDLYDQEQMKV